MFHLHRARRFFVAVAVHAAVVLLLNVLLSAYVWVPAARLHLAAIPLLETLVLIWAVAVAVRFSHVKRSRRLLCIAIGAVFGVLLAFSLAEAFFRFYYARPFYPRSDIPMVRGGLLLLFGDIGRLADILTPITISLILLLSMAVGAGLFAGVSVVMKRTGKLLASLAVITGVTAITLSVSGLPPSLSRIAVSWIGHSESGFVRIEVPIQTGESPDVDTSAVSEPAYALPGIHDRDIYIFAVEAYGYTTVSRPSLSRAIEPHRESLQNVLERKGYRVVTSYLRSPVAGGYSWLAEATLLTGQWIDNQGKFKELYGAELPTLTGMLFENGYYTLTLRPGTIHGEWNEGWEFYRFQESITAYGDGFHYRGPWFSYVPVTDQYALWTGEKRIGELIAPGGEAADRPLLVYHQLVSSHTPFNRIPPLIDDWSELGDGEIYHSRDSEIQRFNNTWTGGTELDEGYVAALTYVFEVLTDYVDRIMDHRRSPIIIVFGDHQPQRPIRTPDAVLSVPVHVASRDDEIIQRFENAGFQTGMKSDESPPHLSMDLFFPLFARIAGGETDQVFR